MVKLDLHECVIQIDSQVGDNNEVGKASNINVTSDSFPIGRVPNFQIRILNLR